MSLLCDIIKLTEIKRCVYEANTYGVIVSDGPGGGSGELGFIVHAKNGEREVVLHYLFYADKLVAPVEVWETDAITE